jgi:hypothetical protein
MKATKFWIAAASTVATAGMIGAAIAQTVTPPTPTTDPSVNVGGQGSTQATIDKGPSASTGETMAQAQTGSSSSDSASSGSTAAEAPVAQADRG